MVVSQTALFLWSVFSLLPPVNLSLLSDYKICADSECERLMSRVQAIRDHRGKDCRFLSFRRGDTIFVYHKLTGIRQDLWAGSIDKQSGYFPKDAVKEEEVYATTEKVVETQKYDFLCMDEYGYPIDSNHLDTDDDDDQEIQNQGPETKDNDAESLPTSEESTTEPPVSAQEVDGTSSESDKNAAEEEEEEDADSGDEVAQDEQGGSPSSSSPSSSSSSSSISSSHWLGPSVTGWLGLSEKGEPGDLADGEKVDESERKERQGEASFTASVTGWLGLGGEGKVHDSTEAEKKEEKEKEVRDDKNSFMSGVTGWLSFGGDRRTDHTEEREQGEEKAKEEEVETGETFRSRRLALDLDGNQLQEEEEEEEERGVLDWLGSRLPSTLGFSLTNQESGHEETTGGEEDEDTVQEVEPSRSWLDIGIGDVLGFGKEKGGVDETVGSGFKERDSEQPKESQNDDTSETSQSQPAPTGEGKTDPGQERIEEDGRTEAETVIKEIVDSIGSSSTKDPSGSEVVGTQKDEKLPSELETESGTASVSTDGNVLDIDGSEDSVLAVDIGPEEVDQEGNTFQTEPEKESQSVFPVGGFSSILDSFLQIHDDEDEDDEDEETITGNEEKSAKNESEVNQVSTPQSVGNKGEDEKVDVDDGTEKSSSKSTSDANQDFISRTDVTEGSTLNSVDSTLGSMGYVVGEDEEDDKDQQQTSKQTETADEEGREIFTNQINNTNDSGTAGDDAFPTVQIDEPTQHSQTNGDEEDSSGASRPSSPPGTAEVSEGKCPREDDILAQSIAEVEGTMMKQEVDSTQEETHHAELGQEAEPHPVESLDQVQDRPQFTGVKTETLQENTPEVNGGRFASSENTPNQDINTDNINQAADPETETEKEGIRPAQTETETFGFENETLKESGLKSASRSETDTETDHELSPDSEFEIPDDLQNDTTSLEPASVEKGTKVDSGSDSAFSETAGTTEKRQTESLGKEEEKMEEVQEEEKMEEVKEEEKKEEVKEEEKKEEVQEEEKEEVEEKKEEGKDEENERMGEESGENLDQNRLMVNMNSTREAPGTESSNELHPDVSATEDQTREERDESVDGVRSIEERVIETGTSDPTDDNEDRRGESQKTPGGGMEQKRRDEERDEEKEEETSNGDEGREEERRGEQGENKDADSNDAGGISDPAHLVAGTTSGDKDKSLVINQTGEVEHRGNDVLRSGETNPGGVSNDMGEKTDDAEYSGESSSPGISADETKQTHSDHQTDNTTQDRSTETEDNNRDISENEGAGMLLTEHDADVGGSGFTGEAERERESSGDVPGDSTGSTVAPEDPSGDTESGGAFGLFKNTFGFFSTETEDSKASAAGQDSRREETSQDSRREETSQHSRTEETSQDSRTEETSQHSRTEETSQDSRREETSQPRAPFTPEQDSTTDSTPASIQELHPSTPLSQLPPPPPSAEPRASPLAEPQPQSHSHPHSPSTAALLSRHYKVLLAHMSVDEAAIVTELFGQHKLQWLDYMLGSSEAVTEDGSILLDMDGLLQYHTEALISPSVRVMDAPQEDKEKTRSLIALQKLDMLLARVKERFNAGKSEVTNTNHQDETNCVGVPCSTQDRRKETTTEEDPVKTGQDSDNHRGEGMSERKEEDGGEMGKEGETENRGSGEQTVSPEEPVIDVLDGSSPDSQAALEGAVKQILDWVHHVAGDAAIHILAVWTLLKWFTVQVRVTTRFWLMEAK